MRTYTRKRPDYQAIDNVHELCRLCLGKCEETVPIFSDDSATVCATLALRIMICVGLEISRDDSLPNNICIECYKELERYYGFRKKCEVSYQKLKSHIQAVKEKQFKALQLQNEENNVNSNNNITEVKSDGNDDEMKFVVPIDKDQLPKIHLNINGVQLHNLSEKLTEDTRVNKINADVENEENEAQVEDESTTDLNISTFLKTMLIEMGILSETDRGLVITDHSIKTIELESGDDQYITLQLTEEDEQIVEKVTEPQPIPNGTDSNTEEPNGIVIQYITSNYKGHTKDIPDTKKSQWCDICGKWLASSSALARHRRVHSGEKPYVCRDCGRAFTQREIMLRHRLVHAEERPFKCTQCEKSFTQRGALAAHARAHAPPQARPLELHRCARCPKVFLYASGLSRHMMMHNGRVYVCGACDKQFRDKSSLLRHLKNTNHAPKDT